MDVILLERVPNLGGIGETVTVKPGFARNYLLPREKALRATPANEKIFEAQRADIENRNAQAREKAENLSSSIANKTFVTIQSASDRGALFGSVTARDIAELASTKKLKLTKAQVVLGQPLKAVGIYDVQVRLHPEVLVDIKVNVARTQDEAERQERGEDIFAAQKEDAVEKITGTGGFDDDLKERPRREDKEPKEGAEAEGGDKPARPAPPPAGEITQVSGYEVPEEALAASRQAAEDAEAAKAAGDADEVRTEGGAQNGEGGNVAPGEDVPAEA